MEKQIPILKSQVAQRISVGPASKVWTPSDFLDLGQRDVVDKTIQRMFTSLALRRIDRGLYDQPRTNQLTGRAAVADYSAALNSEFSKFIAATPEDRRDLFLAKANRIGT